MTKEEIELLVPDLLLPCPRCGSTNVRKSLYYENDDGYPMGWHGSVYCMCGLRSQSFQCVDNKELAVKQLKDFVTWWNTREAAGEYCWTDQLPKKAGYYWLWHKGHEYGWTDVPIIVKVARNERSSHGLKVLFFEPANTAYVLVACSLFTGPNVRWKFIGGLEDQEAI